MKENATFSVVCATKSSENRFVFTRQVGYVTGLGFRPMCGKSFY